MRETIKKSLDETINKSAMKETPVDDDASTNKHADKGAPKSREEAAPVDTSKFIIEANRIYEQGNYEKRQPCTEKEWTNQCLLEMKTLWYTGWATAVLEPANTKRR